LCRLIGWPSAAGGGKGGGERTVLSLCLKAFHLAPRIAHITNQAGVAITRRITSAAMRHPLINFAGGSMMVNLLFNEYYGINDDSDSDNDDNNSGEGMTLIGARVLDGRTGCGKVARTGLHSGNGLTSTSLFEGLIFGSSVGKAVAARASNGLTLLAVNWARRTVKRRLVMMILATPGPSLLSLLSSPSPLLSSSLSLLFLPLMSSSSSHGNSAVAVEASAWLRFVMWEEVGVIRSCMGIKRAVLELSAMLDEAGRLWKEAACGSDGGGHSGGGGEGGGGAARHNARWTGRGEL
jgi:aspartate oxidase